jgi:hypothetical protein
MYCALRTVQVVLKSVYFNAVEFVLQYSPVYLYFQSVVFTAHVACVEGIVVFKMSEIIIFKT